MKHGEFETFKEIVGTFDKKGLKATDLYEYVRVKGEWEQWYKSGNYGSEAKYSSQHPLFNNSYDDGDDNFWLWFILGISVLVFTGAIAIGVFAG
ncbi:MAG: hypothetical protein K9J12_15175 [Melioribacteraceae bacterium]|nr:hypothetical protein [Melioribacteraceae bacterium]MCF8263123.1 hypothetical protein [Melioribacteraceae bacterium]MCF8430545.1 hypothetical protein [Melioribacteraceae bacterium]